jgi:inhibitor of cysteine peptidase
MKFETAAFAIIIVAVFTVIFSFSAFNSVQDNGTIKTFSSYDELSNFVKSNMDVNSYYGGAVFSTTTKQLAAAGESQPAVPSADVARSDYSTTNVQVQGVDEADTVKNDGKYLYVVSGRKVVIIDAYPAQSATNVSEIEFNGTPQQIFVSGNKLVVFGYDDYSYTSGVSIPELGIMPRYSYSPRTFIDVYDITDRSSPVITRNLSIDGNYYQSRMIGDYVYAIVNDNIYYSDVQPIPMPMIRSGGSEKAIAATDVYYFDYPDTSFIFTNVISLNVQNDAQDISTKTFLMGYSESMFVSSDNIYITYTKRLSQYDFYDRVVDEAIIPNVPLDVQSKISGVRNSNDTKYGKIQQIGKIFQDYIATLGPEQGAIVMKNVEANAQAVQEEIAKEMERTVVHKIGIDNGSIEYKGQGEVAGTVLNQFSMDEYNGNFRIATTAGSWGGNTTNNVYVLDNNMQTVGSLEDLASGERIYSVRFMGDRAYLVTFRQVDPLFVIDLSSPSSPSVLGYLKIPGVSDYLHPYDETHIIGVGNNATDEGRINGLKLSLFDVSDVSNPREVSSYVIGGKDMYVSSDALYEHKAFLFDKAKSLMVIPVSVNTYPMGPEVSAQQPTYWQGAYVFNIDLSGITLKGNVTHANETADKNQTYYYDYNSQITRSLYIGDVLYTLSNSMVKMNDLSTLQEINKVALPIETYYPYPMLMSSTGSSGSGTVVAVPAKE